MLSLKGHPTTEEEVKSLQDELLPEHKHKIQALSLKISWIVLLMSAHQKKHLRLVTLKKIRKKIDLK